MSEDKELDELVLSTQKDRVKITKKIINKFKIAEAEEFTALLTQLIIDDHLIIEKSEEGFSMKVKTSEMIKDAAGINKTEILMLMSFLTMAIYEKFQAGKVESIDLSDKETKKVEQIIDSIDENTYLHILSSLNRSSGVLTHLEYNLCTRYHIGKENTLSDDHVELHIHYLEDLYTRKMLNLMLSKRDLEKLAKKITEIQEKMEGGIH